MERRIDNRMMRRSYVVCSVLLLAFGLWALVDGRQGLALACGLALAVGTALLWAPSWFSPDSGSGR